MKKTVNKISIVLASLLLLITTMVSAQSSNPPKADKIMFLNGTTKEGKVSAFVNGKVQFVHKGETLNYEFSKNEIEKIEYASGRTEIVTERRTAEVSLVSMNSKNKLAVIPMIYIAEGSDNRVEGMSYQLQDIAISFLNRSATELKFMDAAELNALLFKKGINDGNLRQYTPKELAILLNVEYVITGSVLQDNGSLVTITNNHTTQRQKIEQHDRYDDKIRITSRSNRNGLYVTKQNVRTRVSLSIYNAAGEKIYTKSRQSILSEPDAYRNTIHYLLKRTPLYKR